MAEFKSFTANVEVIGTAVLSFIDGLGVFKDNAIRLLASNGISNPQPAVWYSQQSFLNAFKTLASTAGPNTIFGIGQKIPTNAIFPPQINNLESALASIDIAYHMNHRNGEIGTYNLQRVSENCFKMICNNPYPCDFDRGIIDSMAIKFKPAGALLVRVTHDNTQPCRKKGADSCTYLISY